MRDEIKVIVYAKKEDQFGNHFKEMIVGLIPKDNLEVYDTIADLSSRLHMPQRGLTIAVLCIADGEDLQEVLTVQPLLYNIRTILMLPDRTTDTIRAGHRLHPRYLSFKDGPLSDIKSVLSRMIKVENMNKTALFRGLQT